MRIIVVGATGTIGSAVVEVLSSNHEVISASRNGDVQIDLSDPLSIAAMYEATGKVDAVISTAGTGAFGPIDALSDEDFAFGLGNKLMGQINLVRYGRDYMNDGGFFTLTSGILADQPNPASVLITTLNAGVEGFARAAALGMPRGLAVNVVSPPMIRETAEKLGWGSGGTPVSEVADYYLQSLEPGRNGTVLGPTH
jgi:NAD(P)-dependent dehydrogenase (short-subunit alcohol dehydrogenase family)